MCETSRTKKTAIPPAAKIGTFCSRWNLPLHSSPETLKIGTCFRKNWLRYHSMWTTSHDSSLENVLLSWQPQLAFFSAVKPLDWTFIRGNRQFSVLISVLSDSKYFYWSGILRRSFPRVCVWFVVVVLGLRRSERRDLMRETLIWAAVITVAWLGDRHPPTTALINAQIMIDDGRFATVKRVKVLIVVPAQFEQSVTSCSLGAGICADD